MADEVESNPFEERAEFLSRVELAEWTAETDRDQAILAKLKNPGAKLLSGPRGSGKSTFLRRAYYSLLDDRRVLPVYVNYARSLALEPLFHRNANALQLFRQWVIAKIVLGVGEALREMAVALPSGVESRVRDSTRYVHSLEKGAAEPGDVSALAVSELVVLLESWAKEIGARRTVLLMDDAAHVFSPEQQREFFEIFRALRTRAIAPKAAVYPGITSYSPNLHIGHEAELIEAWHDPNESGYVETMRSMLSRRLPPELSKRLEGYDELVDYLALASFGIPRGFLVMVSQLLGVEEERSKRPSRRMAERIVDAHAESVRHIHSSLAKKLPRFRQFIAAGADMGRAMARLLRKYNNTKKAGSDKAVTVGITDPQEKEFVRVLSLLEYAGLVRKAGSVSRGEKGTFSRYTLHYAVILSENSLSLGKSFPLASAVSSLAETRSQSFVRTQPAGLLSEAVFESLQLDLAPCSNCGAPRIAEEARFCMKCGSPLEEASVYDELLRAPIENLPLTENKLEGLRLHTSIATVQDILLDEEMQEIRKVPYVGPVWASRIRTAAEEYVGV